jgi:hypothetical protein
MGTGGVLVRLLVQYLVASIVNSCDNHSGKYSPESGLLWKIIPKGYALIRHYWKILGVLATYRVPNSVTKRCQTRKFPELPPIILHELFQKLHAGAYKNTVLPYIYT